MKDFISNVTTDLIKKVEYQVDMSCAFGFYWESVDQILKQIQSECSEIREAISQGNQFHVQEEIGDIIQATICLAKFCNIDSSKALEGAIEKYQKRFERVVALVKEDNLTDLKNQPMHVLLSYWNKAKKHLNDTQ